MRSRRAVLVLWVALCACSDDDTAKTSKHAAMQPDAATAANTRSTPPGYEPESLIPEGYNPPSLLDLNPEQQLDVFSHIEDTFAHTTAARGKDVSELRVRDKQIEPVVTWRDETYADLEAFMVASRTTGLLVLHDGEIVLERYALGRDKDERWTSFSVGKSITSLLVGAAIADGYIQDLDEPVTKYIPDLKDSAYEGVNLRQLLTMTSGVKWNEDYADPNSDVARSSFWPGEPGVNQLVSYMRMLPRAAEPGTMFSYKTGETDMAGILVANATGRGLSDYLSEKIWTPFGMEQDAIWMVDRGSIERGGCCISMTLRDYARVALFVLSGAKAAGKRVVPEWYLKEATSNQIMPPAMGSYGYFWWIGAAGSFSARGIFGQGIQVIPDAKLVVVTNAAWPTAVGQEYVQSQTAFVAAVRAAL